MPGIVLHFLVAEKTLEGEASLLIEAYELVYGVFLPEEVFVRSHQVGSVRVGQAHPGTMRALAALDARSVS